MCDFINGLSQSYFIVILNYAMNLLPPHIICEVVFLASGKEYSLHMEKLLAKFKAPNTIYSEFIQLAHENASDFKLTLNKIKIKITKIKIHTIVRWRNINALQIEYIDTKER